MKFLELGDWILVLDEQGKDGLAEYSAGSWTLEGRAFALGQQSQMAYFLIDESSH